MDNISIERIKTLHPAGRDSAMRVLQLSDVALTGRAVLRLANVFRSFAEQTDLYAQGRTKKGPKVTWAKAGYSFHNYGLAFDIVLIIDGKTASWNMQQDYDFDHLPDWMEVVQICKAEGWEWGGDWKTKKDYPHFEKRFGYTESELVKKYHEKDFIPGTQYVNL
ncbi:M15 family metallopeptidase [Chitinophaga sp. MM2321]|uniref:M15 family metallopeptidase n=1 Tax=Chitinophaga sp. MM2321 TaxID=3137178 RepID=UPI0032D5AF98